MGKGLPVQPQQCVVPPEPRSFRRTARGHRQHRRLHPDSERANRCVPIAGAILGKLVNGEARQPGTIRAEVEIGDGKPMPDCRDALVLHAHGDERIRLLILPGRSRREERE